MLTSLFNSGRDNYFGNLLATVELIEYGDYLCSYSASVSFAIHELYDSFRGEMRVIFRHFPMTGIHPMSLDASMSVEAAGNQGKYWPMHDLILANQKYLNRATILHCAENIDLDMDRFIKDRSARPLAQKIASDFESGRRSGISGTPTFFINGRLYNGFSDFKDLYRACNFMRVFRPIDV